METIKFGLIGKQDIKRGRSSFEVTLADGRVVQLDEVNLDSFDKLLSVEDSGASSVTNLLTVRHTTSGTPAASLGTRITLQGESADENPSDLAAVEAVFDDVTAASEDSTFYLLLRRAGAALSRAFGFRNTGDYLLLLSAALTAARTITFPDATTTLVGTDVAQTLTNKTLTNSLHNASSGSETFLPNGHIVVDLTEASTGANTNETDLISYSLPANTFGANGKGIHIMVSGSTAANTNTKTIRLYLGSTVIVSNDITTAPNNQDWVLEAWVYRDAASVEKCFGRGIVGAANQTANYTGATETTTSAIVIKVTGQNGTANSGDITAELLTVEFLNG